jgi:carbamoylphosphate synthase large subunit
MAEYKNVLIGKNISFNDWKMSLNKINEPNIFFCDFSDFKNLKEILLSKNITYIIPLSEIDYKLIKSYMELLDNKLKILYPTEEIFNLLNNKNLFTDFMLQYFTEYIPEVYYLNNIKLKNITYPSIYKPTYSTNGSNMIIIYDDSDFNKLKNHNNIQKFIEYEYEYGAYMLCIDGVIVTQKIIRFKYEKNYIKKGNFPKNYENVEYFNTDIFKNIISKINYSGGLCINFKVDELTNNIYIFEINPRFGGSAFVHNFIYELLCIL